GAQHRKRQRRAPRAAPKDGHAEDLAAHALAPLLPEPTIGAETSSSGQRDRGMKAKAPSLPARPARSRSMPAQAIMAALSVHSFSGGATKRNPDSPHRVSSVALIVRFAATPPATTSVGVFMSGASARNLCSALRT